MAQRKEFLSRMNYPTPTPEQFKQFQSESAKYVHLVAKYCYRSDGQPGCGVDVASQGAPLVPWAFNVDLPIDEFNHYSNNHPAKGPIQVRAHASKLPFDNDSLDFLVSSHYAEDLPRSAWPDLFGEWKRCLKSGGYMIVLVPEVERWAAYLASGGCPNCSHSAPEPSVGDMSKVALQLGMEVIEERLSNCYSGDYTIIGVFRK